MEINLSSNKPQKCQLAHIEAGSVQTDGAIETQKVAQLRALIIDLEPQLAWDTVKSRILPNVDLWQLILERMILISARDQRSKVQVLLDGLEEVLVEALKVLDECLVPNLDPVESESQLSSVEVGTHLARALRRHPGTWNSKLIGSVSEEFSDFVDDSQNTHNPVPVGVKIEVGPGSISGATSETDSAYACEKCDKPYKNLSHINAHVEKCVGKIAPANWKKSGRQFLCAVPGCQSGKSWTTSTGVWKHIVKAHSIDGGPTVACKFCEKSFPNRTLANEHMNRSHVKKFKCDVCGRGFADNGSRLSHMRIHLGDKPFQCDQCEYRSSNSGGLTTHKKIMHNENRKKEHCCEICGKRFALKSNMKEHILSHSTEKSFLCGVCGKGLKNKQCLNRHLFTHGIKHTCDVCGKNFASISTLTIHRRDKHQILDIAEDQTKDLKEILASTSNSKGS